MNNKRFEKPQIIKGGNFIDQRGMMRFVNDFHFENVKRFYMIKHPDSSVIRAWQFHKFERKYFYPINGKFVIAWIKIDDELNVSETLKPDYHILSAENNEILFLPSGYANGLKALENDSELIVFSNLSLDESLKDNIRFPVRFWLDWTEFS